MQTSGSAPHITCGAHVYTPLRYSGASPAVHGGGAVLRAGARCNYFHVIVGVHVAQSICTVLRVNSREKMPLPGAVSAHRPSGSP